MFRFSFLPGELYVSDTIEDKRGAAILKPWLKDLHLSLGQAERRTDGFRLSILCTDPHPCLEAHLWLALTAQDHLWAILLLQHLTNPADVYGILEVIAMSPMPQGFLQRQSWMSARYLMGL